jgi:hypothetical protein
MDNRASGGRAAPATDLVQLILALAIDGAIGRTRTEVSGRLEALEIFQNRRRNGGPIRAGYIFDEHDFSRLVGSNTPEPGVRNDGSNHPGKALAPI